MKMGEAKFCRCSGIVKGKRALWGSLDLLIGEWTCFLHGYIGPQNSQGVRILREDQFYWYFWGGDVQGCMQVHELWFLNELLYAHLYLDKYRYKTYVGIRPKVYHHKNTMTLEICFKSGINLRCKFYVLSLIRCTPSWPSPLLGYVGDTLYHFLTLNYDRQSPNKDMKGFPQACWYWNSSRDFTQNAPHFLGSKTQ